MPIPPPTTQVPPDFTPLKGHCACKKTTYTLTAPPLITHCCHCTCCQRETGTAFALNALIETYHFNITSATNPILIPIPTPSGGGQQVARCPECQDALYSFYGDDKAVVFVKAGTLDLVGDLDGDGGESLAGKWVRPGVHVFTTTKAGWIDLRGEVERGVKVFERYYKKDEVWSEESLARLARLRKWVGEGGMEEGNAE